jgi:hypothetical protein
MHPHPNTRKVMWIENGFLRRPPPKPDGRFSRIRLSGSWRFDGLAQALGSRLGRSRTSRAGFRPAHLPIDRRSTVDKRSPSRPGIPVHPSETALRHYSDPFGMNAPHLPTPRPCPPLLHGRYPLLCSYEGSDPDRSFGHQPWFPDSRHLNFQPFHLQSSAALCWTLPLPPRHQLYFVRTSPFTCRLVRNRRPKRVHLLLDV